MVKQYDVFQLKIDIGVNIKYVIVLQSGDFSKLRTVIAAPIAEIDSKDRIARIHIPITIEGQDLFVLTAEMGAMQISRLKSFVTNKSETHEDLMSAVDLLFAGF